MIADRIRKTSLDVLHRVVARPPFSGRSALLAAARVLGKDDAVVTLKSGIDLQLDLNNSYQALIFAGNYEANLLDLLGRTTKPGDIFVDGGANIGIHSLLAAKCVGPAGHVFSFEPSPHIFPTARKNIDLNPSLSQRITLLERALSSAAEELAMVPQGTSELESHAVRSSDDRSLPRVRACRIDDVVTSDMTGPIAGMKLDIEGFELEALRGAESFLARPEVILFCELNEKMLRKAGASVDEVVAFLRERGFSFLTVEGEPFDRYDPTWPDYKNAVFHKGSEAARRVQAAFASSR